MLQPNLKLVQVSDKNLSDRYLNLMIKIFNESDLKVPIEKVKENLGEYKEFIFLNNEKDIGTIRIRDYIYKNLNVLKIERVGIIPEEAGKGYGKFMIKKLIESLKNNEKTTLFFSNVIANVKGFYEKLGFEILGDKYQIVGIDHFDALLKVEPGSN